MRVSFEAFYQDGRDLERAPEPQLLVSQHLPEAIHEYFFFHCDRLDDYFKGPANSRLIKDEVFKISQLALFESVLSHLKNRNDHYAKELKKTNPQADSLKAEVDKKEARTAEISGQLVEASAEKKEADQLETTLQKERRTYPSSEEIANLQDRQEMLEKRAGRLEEQFDELHEGRKNSCIKTAPLILGYLAVSMMKSNISIKDAAGLIPPPYRKSFLASLLERDFCICGERFSENVAAKDRVERLYQECESLTDISDELSVELRNLDLIRAEARSFAEKAGDFATKIRRAEEDLGEVESELRTVSARLQSCDNEKIRNCEQRLAATKKRKEKILENNAQLRIERDTLEKEVSALRREYERELKKMHKHHELSMKLLFCNDAMQTAEVIKNEIMDEIRREIERLTSEQFFELIWKKQNFRAVQISDDYEISVLDQNDAEAIGTLSDGERQVLALSFIAALNEISGFDAPIVIDTPLGRISRDPKANIAAKLPDYLRGRQLTILVTEEEYTTDVRQELASHVGKEYRICFRETPSGNDAEVSQYD